MEFESNEIIISADVITKKCLYNQIKQAISYVGGSSHKDDDILDELSFFIEEGLYKGQAELRSEWQAHLLYDCAANELVFYHGGYDAESIFAWKGPDQVVLLNVTQAMRECSDTTVQELLESAAVHAMQEYEEIARTTVHEYGRPADSQSMGIIFESIERE